MGSWGGTRTRSRRTGGHQLWAVDMDRGRGKAWWAAQRVSTLGGTAHGRIMGLGVTGVGHRDGR
eukprot:scaffold157614_cov23-Tisochrysis_lutea.AAC.1